MANRPAIQNLRQSRALICNALGKTDSSQTMIEEARTWKKVIRAKDLHISFPTIGGLFLTFKAFS